MVAAPPPAAVSPKEMLGATASVAGVSKYSARWILAMPATMLDGTLSTLVFSSRTSAL